jgi:hypothetical protein
MQRSSLRSSVGDILTDGTKKLRGRSVACSGRKSRIHANLHRPTSICASEDGKIETRWRGFSRILYLYRGYCKARILRPESVPPNMIRISRQKDRSYRHLDHFSWLSKYQVWVHNATYVYDHVFGNNIRTQTYGIPLHVYIHLQPRSLKLTKRNESVQPSYPIMPA